jgi:hypothetical protein
VKKIKDREAIIYLARDLDSQFDNSFTLLIEKFDPEVVAGEDVIISLFKKGHTVTLKNMAKYDKKYIAFGLLKYMKIGSNLDQFRLMWNLYNTLDPEEVDRTLTQIVDRIFLLEIR